MLPDAIFAEFMTESTSFPRSYRWPVLVFVSLAMFGNYYAFDALNPVGPLLESQLGFTQAQIGLLDSSYNIAALLVLLAGGVFIDRAGARRAIRPAPPGIVGYYVATPYGIAALVELVRGRFGEDD